MGFQRSVPGQALPLKAALYRQNAFRPPGKPLADGGIKQI